MNSTASVPLCAIRLSAADLGQGQLYIQQTRDGLLGSTRLLTATQWGFSPAPERWSIAQIVEHVVAIQELVAGMIRETLPAGPPPPPENNCEIVDNIVMNQIPNRLTKFPSPIALESRLERSQVIQRYVDNCSALSEMLSSVPDLREHVLDSPPLKAVSKGAYSVMDGYQWILATAAHSERHTKQILEVIAGQGFPI